MSKRKPRAPAPADFGPPDWLPLNDAFKRIRELVGSRDLALAYLFDALRDGRLRSGAVHLPPLPSGQYIVVPMAGRQRHILKKKFWGQYEGLTETNSAVRAWPKKGQRATGQWWFFVRRADLDKLYPLAPAKGAETKPPARRRGPATTHDWHTIDGEIAARCIDPKTQRLVVPQKDAKLVKDMLDWCGEEFDLYPTPSEMAEAVRRVLARLRLL